MPKSPIRDHILRLAIEDSELRPHLVRILRAAGGLTNAEQERLRHADVVFSEPLIQDVQAPVAPTVAPVVTPAPVPVVQQVQPAPQVQQAPGQGVVIQQVFNNGAPAQPAPAPAPATGPSGLFIPERAERGFQAEIVPEMDKLLEAGLSREQVARDMMALLRDSFAKKDTLYNILIRYQSSFESNEAYLENLAKLIESWVTTSSGA